MAANWSLVSLLLVYATNLAWSSVLDNSNTPSCRFALKYTTSSILDDPDAFEADVMYWEGMFHQNNVSYNAINGMTFDGTLLNPVTGVRETDGLHTFSAASKESLHFMILTHVILGEPRAVRWILAAHGGGSDVEKAREIAFDILQNKWDSYSYFNATFPGFGGFLPWYANAGDTPLAPTWDWVNRVPGLDNGENIWAIYGLIEALESTQRPDYISLAIQWQSYIDYLKSTVTKVFYRGNGRICAVTDIGNQSLPVDHPDQSYVCEGLNEPGNPYLNDPYEGKQFQWFLYFFGGISDEEKNAIIAFNRPQLVSVDWHREGYTPVTVQKGFWFSAHENWGYFLLPYLDIELMRNLYRNMEVARTCDSRVKSIPGMFASVNNSTDPSGQIIGYISNAGIPELANQTVQERDVITPYSTMNTMLVNKTVGLVWWHNMVVAKRMQNLYGSSESTRIDGTATSAFVSHDSKDTTIVGLLGGVYSIVGQKMRKDDIYDEFISVVSEEWSQVFPELEGVGSTLCLPNTEVANTGLTDFTTCSL